MRHFLARLALVAAPLTVVAQQTTRYNQPPAPIPQMLDAEPLPFVTLSPQRDRILLIRRSALPDIEEISAPYFALAGDRVNPRTNGSWYETTIRGLAIRNIDGSNEIQIAPPARGSPMMKHVVLSVVALTFLSHGVRAEDPPKKEEPARKRA